MGKPDIIMLGLQPFFVSIHVDPEKIGWMKQIDGGSFRQGDVEQLGGSWRSPVRLVAIKPFTMGQYEVTFEEYDRFAIATGRRLPEDQGWGRGKKPVINVSSNEAKDYADWLSKQTGKRYRLPTESEWEYSARSGTKQEVWAGTSEGSTLGEDAVFADNSGKRTAEVGMKRKNSFGLYDLTGNVWEWVEDCWHDNYQGALADGSAWVETNCPRRVLRGGSWLNDPEALLVSLRLWDLADLRNFSLGFRLAQDLEP